MLYVAQRLDADTEIVILLLYSVNETAPESDKGKTDLRVLALYV